MSSVAAKPETETRFHQSQRFFHSPPGTDIFAALLLAVATIALYFPVSSHPFCNYDDEGYVTTNLHVKYGLDWSTVKWSFTSLQTGNWHPLTWLSHALDCELFFLNPARHHQVNLAFHTLNVLVLFWVLWRGTGFLGRSFVVAGLFALHPINVESVAWISERKNVLSMLFFLLALGAYQWYARSPRLHRYVAVFLLFAFGLMAKPQAVTFPFVLLLWDYWPLRRMPAAAKSSTSASGSAPEFPPKSYSWLLWEKCPLFVLCAASAIITVIAQREGGAMSGPMNTFSFATRITNAVLSYVRYLEHAFWPTRLALMYPHDRVLHIWQLVAALAVLLGVTGLALRYRQRRAYLIVGWLWFLGTLVPMIGIVQVGSQAMADRYAYLPLIGIFIMVCWSAADWSQQRRLPVVVPAVVSLVLLVAVSVSTRRQLSYWQDNLALWAHAVDVTTDNYEAQDNLGRTLMDRGRLEEALPHLQIANALLPSDPLTHLYLAFYYHQTGKLRQAIEEYQILLDVTQSDIRDTAQLRDNALMNMGYAYRDLGEPTRAFQCFEAAQQQRRDYAK